MQGDSLKTIRILQTCESHSFTLIIAFFHLKHRNLFYPFQNVLKKSHYQRLNVWSADSGILCFKEISL